MKIKKSKSFDKNGQNRGGDREGAGRKIKILDRSYKDRRILSMWFCDWFSRKLEAKKNRKHTNAEIETFINGAAKLAKPIFKESNNAGCMWWGASRGGRPFSVVRLTKLADAAEKLHFWKQAKTDDKKFAKLEPDFTNRLILRMIAFDGFTDQIDAKMEFKRLRENLHSKLLAFKNTNEVDFLMCKKEVIKAFSGYDIFVDSLPFNPESFYLDEKDEDSKVHDKDTIGRISLDSSIEDQTDGDHEEFLYQWVFRPKQQIKFIKAQTEKIRGDPIWFNLVFYQIWALEFEIANPFLRSKMSQISKKAVLLKHEQTKEIKPTRENPFADIDALLSMASN